MSTIYPTPELFRHHFCKALMEYGEVFVYVNGTKQGVEVPERFKWDSYLPLNLRLEDCCILLDEYVVLASLVFDGKIHKCRIPIDTIFGFQSYCQRGAKNEFPYPPLVLDKESAARVLDYLENPREATEALKKLFDGDLNE